MHTTITILETNFEVEWDFEITASGSMGCAPSLSYPGDPPEPCEYNITVLSIAAPKQDPDDMELDLPPWLDDLIVNHLLNRDDVYEIVEQADQDRGGDDYD